MFNTPPFRRRPQVSPSNPCLADLSLPNYPYEKVSLSITPRQPHDEDTVAAWAGGLTAIDALPLLYELATLVALHTADATPNRGRLGILRAKYTALEQRATASQATLLQGLRSRMLPTPEPVACQEALDNPALPAGVPPVPEGWVYWGERPLDHPAEVPSAYIALCVGSGAPWDFTMWRGHAEGNHYAVRLGSEIALANGLSAAPTPPTAPTPEAGPPAEAPPIPEGFAYWGQRALAVAADEPSDDVMGWVGWGKWAGPMYGGSETNHHCLRIGSAIALANGIPAPEPVPPATPTIPAPPAGFLLYGAGPLAVLPDTAASVDVWGWDPEDTWVGHRWEGSCAGTRANWHYALREGSSIALANGLA